MSERDWTIAATVGKWGGLGASGDRRFWRINLGFVAVTLFAGDFLAVIRGWLDNLESRNP